MSQAERKQINERIFAIQLQISHLNVELQELIIKLEKAKLEDIK
jgi:hypothetical protein